jgi:hypothetical protein
MVEPVVMALRTAVQVRNRVWIKNWRNRIMRSYTGPLKGLKGEVFTLDGRIAGSIPPSGVRDAIRFEILGEYAGQHPRWLDMLVDGEKCRINPDSCKPPWFRLFDCVEAAKRRRRLFFRTKDARVSATWFPPRPHPNARLFAFMLAFNGEVLLIDTFERMQRFSTLPNRKRAAIGESSIRATRTMPPKSRTPRKVTIGNKARPASVRVPLRCVFLTGRDAPTVQQQAFMDRQEATSKIVALERSEVYIAPLVPWSAHPHRGYQRTLMRRLLKKWPSLEGQLELVELEIEPLAPPDDHGLIGIRVVT